jgi:hypothetical protein
MDCAAAMGYATTRADERVAAAMGALVSAPIQFEAAQDVPKGGVLLALPALLAVGLLRHMQELYKLPNGFYGIASIFLLLALGALARIQSIEQLRYVAPGEWGNLLGLDRIPEVRTLRKKLELLCQQAGQAARWNTQLAQEWIAAQRESEMVFYIDGHVRVYSGELTPLPRHYVARERLCLRGTTDYWINCSPGSAPWMGSRSCSSIRRSIRDCWPRSAAIWCPGWKPMCRPPTNSNSACGTIHTSTASRWCSTARRTARSSSPRCSNGTLPS